MKIETRELIKVEIYDKPIFFIRKKRLSFISNLIISKDNKYKLLIKVLINIKA